MNDRAPNPAAPLSSSCTPGDASTGDAAAQFGLGFMLAAGATPDYPRAMEWYFKAADQNHRLAQFNLGLMFALGHGVDRNDSTAAMWIRRAANGGDAGAQFNLGDRCHRATLEGADAGLSELRIECCKWYRLAAAQGYRDAADRADSAAMRMTLEEVSEATRRVSTFPQA